MADIKISELEPTTDLEGLYTLGSDKNNLSKKVSLQFLKTAADYANTQGDYAKGVADGIASLLGIEEYSQFSESVEYPALTVVMYNGQLYRFTQTHYAGAWLGTDVEKTSVKGVIRSVGLGNRTNEDVTTTMALRKRVDYDRYVGSLKIKVGDQEYSGTILNISADSYNEIDGYPELKVRFFVGTTLYEALNEGSTAWQISKVTDVAEWEQKLAQLDQELSMAVAEGESDVDFQIEDENGNALVQFANGHIRTKNFDSGNISFSQQTSSAAHKRFGFMGMPSFYVSDIPSEVCSSATQPSEVYAIYDSLISQYPNYVSKSLLGNDSANFPIYEYSFGYALPPYVHSATGNDLTEQQWPQDPRPKELIISGVHGDEKGSVWGLALLMKNLCECSDDSPLYFIKTNVVLKVIPIVNVWGFVNNSRNNANGVNINRDYVASSQVETRIVKDFYETHKNTAICFYDFHNTTKRCGLWNNSQQFTTQSMLLAFSRHLEQAWKKQDASLDKGVSLLQYYDFDTPQTSEGYFFLSKNILCSVIEASRSASSLLDTLTQTFDAMGIKSGMDLLANMMIMAITLMR